MENRTIRRASAADEDGLVACLEAAYAAQAARIADLPPMAADCASEIANLQVWVALAEDSVVAGLVLKPQDDFMQLVNVAVHPDHRGSGLGRSLIELAERESKDQGFREMRLTTHREMPENVRLYAHLGWEELERRGNKVSMRKAI